MQNLHRQYCFLLVKLAELNINDSEQYDNGEDSEWKNEINDFDVLMNK